MRRPASTCPKGSPTAKGSHCRGQHARGISLGQHHVRALVAENVRHRLHEVTQPIDREAASNRMTSRSTSGSIPKNSRTSIDQLAMLPGQHDPAPYLPHRAQGMDERCHLDGLGTSADRADDRPFRSEAHELSIHARFNERVSCAAAQAGSDQRRQAERADRASRSAGGGAWSRISLSNEARSTL